MRNFNHLRSWASFSGLILLLMTVLCASESGVASPSNNLEFGQGLPQLEDSFAVSSIWEGQPWRVYVQGSDSGADMKYLWVEVTQLGSGKQSTELIPLKGKNRRAFSGYLNFYLSQGSRDWQRISVEIRIRDEAGNLSQARTQELLIGSPTKEAIPEKWRQVAGKPLGNIIFELEGPGGSGDDLR